MKKENKEKYQDTLQQPRNQEKSSFPIH